MHGRRLPDAQIGSFPMAYEDLQPGDYWRVTVRDKHPDYPRPLNVREHRDDRRWWGSEDDPRFDGNLTGGVWGVVDPVGRYGMLSVHTVREHDDGTISVRPGDGSSNSILITGGSETAPPWHGYIDHGVWQAC